MKALYAVAVCVMALSAPTWAQTASQDEAAVTSTDAAPAPQTTDEDDEADSQVVCRSRPRAASRLSARSARICMTARDWRIADAEAQDELRRMTAPGAVNRANPNGP